MARASATQRLPVLPRAHSTPGAPAITCLPFLDCCMLWLLQDPMGRHGPAATAPSHAGGSREGREEQPSPGTTRRAGQEPGRPSSPQGGRRGAAWPTMVPTGGPHWAANRQSPAVSHSGRAKQRTDSCPAAHRNHCIDARKGAPSAPLLTRESQHHCKFRGRPMFQVSLTVL